MCYNGDYLCALFAVDSLCMRCFKSGMRQALSFAATFLTESLSTFIANSLSDYAFFKHLFCLKASNSSGHPLSVYYQFSALPPTFPSMLSIPYQTTTVGKPPTYINPLGPIPMQNLTGNNHNQDYNQKYVDLTTNSERLPPRPLERSTLEKTYARWCCGSILGVIAWIVVVFLLITVPIVVVALRNLVSLA